MKNLFVSILVLVMWAGVVTSAQAQEEVLSLRGDQLLEQESSRPEIMRWQPDRDPIPRDYVQQPPLIPHSINNYKINLKFNKCLTCHSWTNYKEANATKISQTHFADRNENVMANVAARRYFCTQCHVSQVETKPLVENTFVPVSTIKEP